MANRAVLITGALVCLGSMLLLVPTTLMASEGVREIDDADFDISSFYYGSEITNEDVHQFTFEYIDDDNLGSLPWVLMVQGNYSDDDGDGDLDACQSLVLVVHDELGANLSDDDIGAIYCTREKNLSSQDTDQGDRLADIGLICDTLEQEPDDCQTGVKYTVSLYDENGTSVPFTLYDSDASAIAYIDSIAGGLFSVSIAGLTGFMSCCGLLLGATIFIFGLFIGTPLPTENVFVYESPNDKSTSVDSNGAGEWWDEVEKKD